MSSTDIPQEIVDSIVDDLRNNLYALQKCSLISPSFLASSRRHRFASITLESPLQCEHLLAVLSFSPEIIPIITALHIIERHWAYQDSCFPSILQLLADHGHLAMLHLEDEYHWLKSFDAAILRSSAIEDLFKSIWRRKVILDGFPLCLVPVELVMLSPSLQHITFNGGACSKYICDAYIAIGSPPPPSIQLLSLRLPDRHAGPLMKYLQPSLSQLRSLVIWTDHTRETEPLMLAPLPTLRLIAFNLNETTVEPLRHLAAVGLPNKIEYVAFCIQFPTSFFSGFPETFYRQVDERLAAIITGADALPHLKSVSFLVYPSHRYPSPEEVEGYLPCLKQTGLLRCITGTRNEVSAALGAMEALVQ